MAQAGRVLSTHLGCSTDVRWAEKRPDKAPFCVADSAQEFEALGWFSVQHLLKQVHR